MYCISNLLPLHRRQTLIFLVEGALVHSKVLRNGGAISRLETFYYFFLPTSHINIQHINIHNPEFPIRNKMDKLMAGSNGQVPQAFDAGQAENLEDVRSDVSKAFIYNTTPFKC